MALDTGGVSGPAQPGAQAVAVGRDPAASQGGNKHYPIIAQPLELARVLTSAITQSQGTFRPLTFKVANAFDITEVVAGIRATLAVDVFDEIHSQLAELIRIRHPRLDFSREQSKLAIEAHLGRKPTNEYGLWVFYPWSRRLVHLLDEDEFIEVRTNRNLYKISGQERAALATKKVGVIGLSAGQAIALTMASERSCGELRLADFDALELSNLNRIRGAVHQLGVGKALIAAREITEIDPFLDVVCMTEGVTQDNIDRLLLEGGRLDVLFEECDSIDIKLLARERAREQGIPVVMSTSDRGLIDVERFDLEPRRPLLHGLIGDVRYGAVSGLTYEEKIPYALKIVGTDIASVGAKASMLEIKQTIVSWPQLASSVALGGAAAADVGRRILLQSSIPSGRYFVDLDGILMKDEWKASFTRHPVGPPHVYHTQAQLEDMANRIALGSNAERLDREVVEALVKAGGAAPSGGNAQPWRWAYGRRLLLLLRDGWDRTFLDFGGRGSCAAAGAAAENVLLTASLMNLHCTWLPFPLGESHACVAAFALRSANVRQSLSDQELAKRVFERHTNRGLLLREPIENSVLTRLTEAAASVASAQVKFVSEEDKLVRIAQLLGEAQQLQLQHPEGHAQLVDEVRWGDIDPEPETTGIPIDALELSPLDRAGLEICRDWRVLEANREWGGGRGLRRLAEKAVQSAGALGLVHVPSAGLRDFLAGGRAMQRTWLAATADGIGFHPMAALPYMAERVRGGGRESLPAAMAQRIEELWNSCCREFGLPSHTCAALLFRLIVADPPAIRSRRRSPDEDLVFF